MITNTFLQVGTSIHFRFVYPTPSSFLWKLFSHAAINQRCLLATSTPERRRRVWGN